MWFRSPKPGPRFSKQGPRDCGASPKADTLRGTGAGQAAEGESVGCSPLHSSSRIARKEKAGTESRQTGGIYIRTLTELASRPPSPSVFAPVQTGP